MATLLHHARYAVLRNYTFRDLAFDLEVAFYDAAKRGDGYTYPISITITPTYPDGVDQPGDVEHPLWEAVLVWPDDGQFDRMPCGHPANPQEVTP